MSFKLSITNYNAMVATVEMDGCCWDVQLGIGFWTSADYLDHWAFTCYGLIDDLRTKFLILEARETGAKEHCRAFQVTRTANHLHFQDVLIAAPATIPGYGGESLIEWLNLPQTPILASRRTDHEASCSQAVPEFIVDVEDFKSWFFGEFHRELEATMTDKRRRVDELATKGDWA